MRKGDANDAFPRHYWRYIQIREVEKIVRIVPVSALPPLIIHNPLRFPIHTFIRDRGREGRYDRRAVIF